MISREIALRGFIVFESRIMKDCDGVAEIGGRSWQIEERFIGIVAVLN